MPARVAIHVELKRGHLAVLLACFLVGIVSLALDSENLTLTTSYPAPSGVYQKILTTNQAVLARDGGNVGIGTANPNSSASPANGVATGNLDVNDIYVRSLGKWLSQVSLLGSWTDYGKQFGIAQTAPSDGIVTANARVPTGAFVSCLDPAGSPVGGAGATTRQVVSGSIGIGNACAGLEDYACTMAVKKGDTWAVLLSGGGSGTCADDHIWFMPLQVN